MKSKIQLLSFYACFILLIASCTAPSENASNTLDLNALRPEIQAMEDAYAAAEKAKDADAVAMYYSDDAVRYLREKEPLSGIAAIKEDLAMNLADDTTGTYNVYKVVDLFGEGKLLVEIGSWEEMDASGTCIDKGYYLSYFEKRDGKYKCVRDISVKTMPMAMTEKM